MAKRKGTLLSQALVIADALSDQEQLTLFDYLRAKQVLAREEKRSQARSQKLSESKPERKPSQKRKAGKEATAAPSSDGDDSMRCRKCGSFFDENVHHLTNRPDYHVYEPAGEASKGVGA